MRENLPSTLIRRVGFPLVFWLVAPSAGFAQDRNEPAAQSGQGFQIRSLSGFAFYSTSLPLSSGFQPVYSNLPSDGGAGASALLGWSRFRERTNIQLNYSASYAAHLRYSGLNALDHAASINITRKLAPLWTLNLSAAAEYSSIQQFLFSPTAAGNLAAIPATFDDLSAAILTQQSTNPLLAPAVNSAPLVESPARNLLYGSRMFTSGAQASLTRSYSPRLSVSFNAGGSRSQHVSENHVIADRNAYLLPSSTSASAGLGASYALSPATQLGGSVIVDRVASSRVDVRLTTTSLATLGRTLGTRWLLQVHGGVAVLTPLGTAIAQPATLSSRAHPVGGGTIGLKTISHTILASFDRAGSDAYGLGSTTTSSSSASWRWRRPGRPWWVESSLTWERLRGSTLTNTSGWRTISSFGRTAGTHMAVVTEYVYLNYSGWQQTRLALSESAVRLSVVWSREPTLYR
jgi:hypothetical protein